MPGINGAGKGKADEIDIHVGRRIQRRRHEIGVNQTDLARYIGVTFQQVQKYEKGTNRVSASKLFLSAKFLKVPFGYFVEGLDGGEAAEAEAATRYSIEVGRLMPKLEPAQQKLILDMTRSLTVPA